jgi:tetratricopeptide (TPR) repeat protein
MYQALAKCCVGPALAMLLFTACSKDPAKEKAAFFASGQKYAKAGKYPEAVIQFRNAIEVDPGYANGHYQLAQVYLKLKASQLAYRELLKTVELDAKNTDAQLQLAALLIGGHKYDDAQKAAERIIATDPRNARGHTILGQKHAALQAWPQAMREFQTAIALDPAAIESYSGLALVYASTSRIPQAEAILRKVTEAQPRSVDALLNLGRFYLVQHRDAEAEATLLKASETDPRATLPRVLLAKMYLESGKLVEAERVCRELKSLATDDPEGYGALASFYEAAGKKEKAAEELQVLLAARPRDVSLKMRLTDVLIDLNRIDDAARLNQELLKASSSNPNALSSKGRILIARGNYEEAKSVLVQAIQSDPQSAAAHYLLGVAESSLSQFDLARNSFGRALELSPGMTDAAVALADLEARNGDYDDALRRAEQVLQKNPNSALAYVVAAKVLIARGNPSQAEVQLRSALDLDPVFQPALATMLDLRVSQGRTLEMLQRLSALLAEHPRNAKLHLLLGQAYLKHNELAKAEASVKQAIAIDRKTPDAYGVLAEISRARGALERAVVEYRQAVEQNPKKVENYMALASVYGQQGNWEEAKRAAEHAHSLDSASPFIANNLAYLYLEHGGDIGVALSLAQQAKQKLPNSPIVSDTLGWAYYKLGSPKAAVAQLSESVMRSPGDPMHHYHLGMAYIAAGRLSSATQSLQQALSTSPDFPYAASARAALRQMSRSTP